MAQLGNTVIKGSLTVTNGISGSVDNAVGDGNGNQITLTYGASLIHSKDGSNNAIVSLKNKNGDAISTVTITPWTLDNILQAGASSSRAITLSGTVNLSGTITMTGAMSQSGLINITNDTEYTSSSSAAVRIAGGLYVAKKIYCSSSIEGSTVIGAVWNDIAEYREVIEDIEPGTIVREMGEDKLIKTWNRLEPGCSVVSDTYGFCMGKTEKASTPVSIAGRVLVKYCGRIDDYEIGQAVCSGPDGCITPMSRKEIIEYPDAILGFVSSFPSYEKWGTGDIKVGRRIWIKLR